MATLHRLSCLNIDDDERTAFLGLCIASSTLGVLGATFLLVTLRQQYARVGTRLGGSGSFYLSTYQIHIIVCLGVCDLIACIGVIARSVLWFIYNPKHGDLFHTTGNVVWVVIVEVVVTGSYIATFLWTCCYAIDIYSFMTRRSRFLYCYHVAVWFMTGSLVVLAMVSLFGVAEKGVDCSKTLYSVLYDMCFLLPILTSLLFLPIVYIMASCYTVQFVTSGGIMGEIERRSITILKLKFFLFALAFYICWFPTAVDLIWLLTRETSKEYLEVPFALWMVEAVVNPLQALFNGFLYSKTDFWRRCLVSSDEATHDDEQTAMFYSRTTPDSMEGSYASGSTDGQCTETYASISNPQHSGRETTSSRNGNYSSPVSYESIARRSSDLM
ncbi:G-protein coupled receptor 143-like isoform X2 [Corticium candelabrum]|uniref:G-protein coupled receptor 143-like isoform X2 n=1 Tax=Corticium candelabrum TaxID=121492 RepID=UPI002E258391|nr:G-protein coupled receptor 143-like isoform X2 [Corticium candelabrum]